MFKAEWHGIDRSIANQWKRSKVYGTVEIKKINMSYSWVSLLSYCFKQKHLSIDKWPLKCKEWNLLYTCKKVLRPIARIFEHSVIFALISQQARLPTFHGHSQKTALFSVEQKDFVIHCNKSMASVAIFWYCFCNLQYLQLDAQGPKSSTDDWRPAQAHPNVWSWLWLKRTHSFWTTSKSTFCPRWRCYFHFPMLGTLQILISQ